MKEKFLKDLEKKLSVLSNEEKQDIITEYSDIIDEKIKHGKTEEEAIKEFGDVKELSKEILKAYKIDPDYNRSDFGDKTNEFIKSSEDLIKKGAQKLSDVTEDVVEGIKNGSNDLDTTQIFEIIIKVILVLVGLAILKIPFYIIGEIGNRIFDIGSFPFGGFTSFAWSALIEIIYVVVCVLVVFMVVSKYTKNRKTTSSNIKETQKKETTKNTKSEVKKDSNTKFEAKKDNVKEVKSTERRVQNEDGFGNFLLILVKIWCIILILIPLWFAEVGLMIAICVAIFLIIKGISIYGILLLLLGVVGMFFYFTDIVWKLLFSKKNIHICPIFINMILIIFGGLLTFDYFANLEYANKIPDNIKLTTTTYEEKIDTNLLIHDYYDIVIDDTLEDNKIKIELTYYDELYDRVNVDLIKQDGTNSLEIDKDYEDEIVFWDNKVFNKFMDNLKDKKIYNYSLLNNINVKIYSNTNTSKLFN